MKWIEITRPGRFGKFEGRLMRSQHLDPGAVVEYPNRYADSLIASGWAVEVKAVAPEPEPLPELATPPIVEIDVAHPFFEIAGVRVRQVNALLAAGYTTLDHLRIASADQLLAIDGIGAGTVARIQHYLGVLE